MFTLLFFSDKLASSLSYGFRKEGLEVDESAA